MIALGADLDTSEKRDAWANWISIVLGLPANRYNDISELARHGEVADQLAERVVPP